ncbi:nucleotidyltransferase domain-containing protein [Metabacillus bambusae]|uniref:Nucleotidyltransferase domain-containing protein n=1 Tax=Metabacillus bambusae TaxID=2795218 RepID=A0ABS3MYY9_9BACI|nr:nucleotidyltransferase domain-containing protein [Metabacillus bambusae]MBO1511030.1 nucleotidyltransferase domain-containing protein [Metabacillus bambusae]
MEIKKKTDVLLTKFKEWSEQQSHIKGVAVVGSFARGDFHSNSDVDLTIISTNKKLTLRLLKAILIAVILRVLLLKNGEF